MRGNYNILTDEQLKQFDSKYYFTLSNDYIIVCNKSCDKQTAHNRKEIFCLSISKLKVSIKITPYAINVWEEYYKDKYSLFEIQNVINKLIILCQTPNINDIESQLSGKSNKVLERN